MAVLRVAFEEQKMLSHREMIGLQAEKHDLIDPDVFTSEEEYVLHPIHTAAYEKAAKLASGRSVLDLGCNTGYGTEIMSRTAARIVGVDVSRNAVDFARDKYGGSGMDFRLIDGERLPFADGEFDLIVSCQVIEHIVDHVQFMGELKRVLSPVGMAVLTTPNAGLRLDPGMAPWNPFHVREYLADELTEMLSTYFGHVSVLGLFASEPIYRIEKARVDKARMAARDLDASIYRSPAARIRRAIKASIPGPMIDALRKARDTFKNASAPGSRALPTEYGLDELYYRKEDPHAALDLLALCSDDGDEHATALRTLDPS